MQKSSDFGVQFADLQKQQIQVNINLALAKENLKKAQDEATAMGGNNLSTACFVLLLFHSLNRVTLLEQMCVVKTDNSKLV